MKSWRGYTLFDLILVIIGAVGVVVPSLIFKSGWVVMVQCLLYSLCVFTQAKGKIATQVLGIFNSVLYIYIAYTEKLFGESILYLTVLLPMYIYGVIHWMKNRAGEDDVVKVRSNLKLVEWMVMMVGLAIISVGVYFLLKVLNTSKLVLSTLSFVSMLPAVYLLIRRCKWNLLMAFINDIFALVLWLLIVLEGDTALIPMVIAQVIQLVYDAYGMYEWMRLENKQRKTKKRLKTI